MEKARQSVVEVACPHCGGDVAVRIIVDEIVDAVVAPKRARRVPFGAVDLPANVDPGTWDAFVEMRRRIRAPLTGRACVLAVRRLEQLAAKGEDANRVLEQSIELSWRGLFPVRRDGQDGRRPEVAVRRAPDGLPDWAKQKPKQPEQQVGQQGDDW